MPVQVRHLEMTRASLQLCDKPTYYYARGRRIVEDTLEMIRIAHGLTEEELRQRAYSWTNINTNSPRQLDIAMGLGIIDAARAGQMCIMTPFTLAGAMAR